MRKKLCPLHKRIFRIVRKNWGKYLGMVLILTCTIAIGSSFQSVLDSAFQYLDQLKTEYLQEDGYFEVAQPLDNLSFLAEEKVDLAENFYVRVHWKDAVGLVFDEREEINLPVLFEGKMPETENEIVLDHVFMRSRGLKAGDTMVLDGNTFTICGSLSMPDYTSLFLNNTDLVMNTTGFFVSMVSQSGFERFPAASVIYRYSWRTQDRNLDLMEKTDLAKEIQQALIGQGLLPAAFLTADQNQSVSFLEMDMGSDGPSVTAFVYILIVLIAFLFAILTRHTLEQESVVIGTLRASGYSKAEIFWHYLQPCLLVSLAGSLLGNLLGYTWMIDAMLNLYYSTYSIGPLEIHFSISAFLLTTLLPVLLMTGITAVMLWCRLKLTPLQFMRREFHKNKTRKAAKLPGFSFPNRFRLRIVLQNKGSFVLLFFGIFLASFLLMFGLGLKPLMDHYTEVIDASLPFEYEYILKAPMDADNATQVQVYEMKTWFDLGQKEVSVSLWGLEPENKLFPEAGKPGEIFISSALADKLHVKKGSMLQLTDPYTEKEWDLEIEGIIAYDAGLQVFMNRRDLNEMLEADPDAFNVLLSNTPLDLDESLVTATLERKDFLGAARQMMDSFSTVLIFFNVFSVLIYVIMLYILTKVIIDRNALSMSFMKVFGYRDRELLSLFLQEAAVFTLIALIICIPVEVMLFKVVLVWISSQIEGLLPFYLPWWLYTEIIIMGVIVCMAVTWLHIRNIKKVDMAAALKHRE